MKKTKKDSNPVVVTDDFEIFKVEFTTTKNFPVFKHKSSGYAYLEVEHCAQLLGYRTAETMFSDDKILDRINFINEKIAGKGTALMDDNSLISMLILIPDEFEEID